MVRGKSQPLDRNGLMNYALRTLTARALSTSELRAKLERRAAEPSDVGEVIAKLEEAGYLNDRRFAESYAAARLENQGFGRQRVLRDLRQRRVAGELAAGAVARTFEDTNEPTLIAQFLERKYRGVALGEFLSVNKNLVNAYRRLRVAGFSTSASIRVLKQYAAQADALEQMEDPEG